ncbi:hypothetical protein SISNIDRAFT_454431 [Sistotremastrum niveocremeum HHB9708]|uniref:Uncharacterized protein n=1 Tax=Sistotremastrum niveocremeum HHB9708 TaxID=1314777 RepID=A0A164UJD7_9AGAM|nr:hypothetical protein SISNIDRAFT_454431 [Sistotremastrum niveocremeum HHB9708]
MSTIDSSRESISKVDSSDIHASLRQSRLNFPPTYIIVGVYRLVTTKSLYVPIWDKCRHGVQRGVIVAAIWTGLTFNIQRAFVKLFLVNSPRVTGLSHDTLFGYKLPFTVTTYATILFISSQIHAIIFFFLSKNIRIARDRAWDETVKSRGKGPEFWQPYVEEWQNPPAVEIGGRTWEKWVGNWLQRYIVQRVILLPLNFYPGLGLLAAAYFKGITTSRYLHKPYFAAKKMTQQQVAVFMEERKYYYRAFGFAAALVESLPIIGLLFSVSNRIGAAMWAHDLEKIQHMHASGELKPLQPRIITLPGSETELAEIRPKVAQGSKLGGRVSGSHHSTTTSMSGSWEDINSDKSL